MDPNNTKTQWFPLREAYGRKLQAEDWPYDDLSFYEKRWSYLLFTWSPEFRPFIILRDNIEISGKMIQIAEHDIENFPEPTASEQKILDQFPGKLVSDSNYSVHEAPFSGFVRRTSCSFELPKENVIPISIAELDSIPNGQSIYGTTLMEKIFQNCYSAELYMDSKKYMDMSIHELDSLYGQPEQWTRNYTGVKLPPDILKNYSPQQFEAPDDPIH